MEYPSHINLPFFFIYPSLASPHPHTKENVIKVFIQRPVINIKGKLKPSFLT